MLARAAAGERRRRGRARGVDGGRRRRRRRVVELEAADHDLDRRARLGLACRRPGPARPRCRRASGVVGVLDTICTSKPRPSQLVVCASRRPWLVTSGTCGRLRALRDLSVTIDALRAAACRGRVLADDDALRLVGVDVGARDGEAAPAELDAALVERQRRPRSGPPTGFGPFETLIRTVVPSTTSVPGAGSCASTVPRLGRVDLDRRSRFRPACVELPRPRRRGSGRRLGHDHLRLARSRRDRDDESALRRCVARLRVLREHNARRRRRRSDTRRRPRLEARRPRCCCRASLSSMPTTSGTATGFVCVQLRLDLLPGEPAADDGERERRAGRASHGQIGAPPRRLVVVVVAAAACRRARRRRPLATIVGRRVVARRRRAPGRRFGRLRGDAGPARDALEVGVHLLGRSGSGRRDPSRARAATTRSRSRGISGRSATAAPAPARGASSRSRPGVSPVNGTSPVSSS